MLIHVGFPHPGAGRLMRPDATALNDLSPYRMNRLGLVSPKNFTAGSHLETLKIQRMNNVCCEIMSETKGNMLDCDS